MGLHSTTVGFAYVIVVLLTSLRGSLVAATIASVVATLAYNFFFFPPLHTLRLEEPTNWFALAAFLVSAVTVSRLVVAARVQAQRAERRGNELETLYGLSIDLFAATDRAGAVGQAAGRALELLGARAGGLLLFVGSPPREQVLSWRGERPAAADGAAFDGAVAEAARQRRPLEIAAASGRDVYLPLVVDGHTIGMLVARGTEASQQALESAGRLVALALERERFLRDNAHLEALRESEALKTSLLRAISHDLATPITAIVLRTESLRRRAGADGELREDVAVIAEETGRLRRRIDNLMAMARLEAGKARPRPEPTPAADLFRAARENLPLVWSSRPVSVAVGADCPDAFVDPSLTLEILVNLVENAHSASPPGAPLELTANRHPYDAGRIRIEVLDRGPGLPPGGADGEAGRAVATSDVAQRGLGLEIARSLALANGGTVALLRRDGGGTVAQIDLPGAVLGGAGDSDTEPASDHDDLAVAWR